MMGLMGEKAEKQSFVEDDQPGLFVCVGWCCSDMIFFLFKVKLNCCCSLMVLCFVPISGVQQFVSYIIF